MNEIIVNTNDKNIITCCLCQSNFTLKQFENNEITLVQGTSYRSYYVCAKCYEKVVDMIYQEMKNICWGRLGYYESEVNS